MFLLLYAISIASAYTNPELTFREVVDHVSVSACHFSITFSRAMGCTFTRYLTNLRLRRAQELLRTTDMRSSEATAATGFNDSHYFCHLFKKRLGITPIAYRAAAASSEGMCGAQDARGHG